MLAKGWQKRCSANCLTSQSLQHSQFSMSTNNAPKRSACLWLNVESDRGECHQTPPNAVKESPNLKNSLRHVINRQRRNPQTSRTMWNNHKINRCLKKYANPPQGQAHHVQKQTTGRRTSAWRSPQIWWSGLVLATPALLEVSQIKHMLIQKNAHA